MKKRKKEEKEKEEMVRPGFELVPLDQINMLIICKTEKRTMHPDKSLNHRMLRIGWRFRPHPRYPVEYNQLRDQRGRRQSDPRP